MLKNNSMRCNSHYSLKQQQKPKAKRKNKKNVSFFMNSFYHII